MTVFADYEFYKSLGGDLNEKEFSQIAAKASAYIDKVTFGRAAENFGDERVKRCCCELCDTLSALSESGGLVKQSESVGSWSVTYANSENTTSEVNYARCLPCVAACRVALQRGGEGIVFESTVTIYNIVEEDFKKKLLPRLLTGVHVEKTHGSEKAAEGDKNADSLLVIIPFKQHINGYLTPLEFEKCEDKAAHWTLAPGDVITVGDTGSADSFKELTARTEPFRVLSVQTFDFGGLKHWKVTAK